MTLYVRKLDLFSATEIHQEEKIPTNIGEITVYEGDVVLRNMLGHTLIVNKKGLEEIYAPVEKVKKPKVDIEEMAANYAQEWRNFDEEDYINEFQENVRKRNGLNNN